MSDWKYHTTKIWRSFDRTAERFFDGFEKKVEGLFESDLFDGFTAEMEHPDGIRYQVDKTEDNITINVELPGYSPDMVLINVKDGFLVLSQNLVIPRVMKRFKISGTTDLKDIKVVMRDGLLTIVIHRTSKGPGPSGNIPINKG